MSADFVSLIAWLPSPDARKLERLMATAEHFGAIVSVDGETLHDPYVSAGELSLRALAERMKGEGAAPAELAGSYLSGFPLIDDENQAELIFSSNFAIVSVIDRVIAIPRGMSFLRGHAFRRFRPKARDSAAEGWVKLVADVGGERKMAGILGPYIDRGGDAFQDARGAIQAIGFGFARAQQMGRDLVIAGCIASEILE